MKPTFSVYVIQIGNNTEVLYVNYSLNRDKSYYQFLHKHPHLQSSILRPDLCQHLPKYRSSRQAHAAALYLIHDLERRGLEVIAGGPLMNDYWQTYVIEIDGNPYHVYVGETNYPRDKRFQQHIYHYNSARALEKCDILSFASELCDAVKYVSKQSSLAAERQKAAALKAKGYRVEGGT